MEVIFKELAGRRLNAVVESRHWYGSKRDADAKSLTHAWLCFQRYPPLMLHGWGEELHLSIEDPHGSYDMAEYGEVKVGEARRPDFLAQFVGAQLLDR